MTGFGKVSFSAGGKNYDIEIKTLNSKSADINVKLIPFIKHKEFEIRTLLASELERGKIDCSISVSGSDIDNQSLINKSLFKLYYKQLSDICTEMDIPFSGNDTITAILRIPDVLKTDQTELDNQEWHNISEQLKVALSYTNNFRIQEGLVLKNDMISRIVQIKNLLKQIEIFEPERIKTIRTRIANQLTELQGQFDTDKNRFEQELIYYIEKIDFSEEKTRLLNHCNYFISTIETEESVGKKLGFIIQEIGREINTLGSKANNSDIQKIVVQMKDELEKIKEQTMNVL